MICTHHRLFKLEPWLVRAVIPQGKIGVYVLYISGKPVYAGRSDEDLRSRLVAHASVKRAEYFGFGLYSDASRAFDIECALFHALEPCTTNLIHPASPKGSGRICVVCTEIRHLKNGPFRTT